MYNFFLGVVSLQVIFVGAYFILFRKKEFLFYLLFTLFLTFFILGEEYEFLHQLMETVFGKYASSIFNFSVPLSALFYYKFIRHFTESPQLYPKLNRRIRIVEQVMLSVITVLFGMVFITSTRASHMALTILMFTLTPLNIYFLIMLLLKRTRLNVLIVIGTLLFVFFGRLAVLSSLFKTKFFFNSMDDMIAFSITGIILNFLFFNFSLIYKSKYFQLENIRLEVERQVALNNQRLSISNDLHDDIGSSLSSIQLALALAAQSQQGVGKDNTNLLLKVSEEVKGVLENMNDIIWAVKKGNTEEKSFSNRIKDYYFDLMDARHMECVYEIDRMLEASIVSSSVRKNLLLITKEAINNALKHSKTEKLVLKLFSEEGKLILEVQDFGVGIPQSRYTAGIGLESMRHRCIQMGGELEINSSIETGTQIVCKIPLDRL